MNIRSALLLTTLLVLAGCEMLPWSTSSDGERVDVGGTQLFVKRIGQGDPIVVIHGGPVLEHSYLLPHLLPLADSHELIFYDQRLCGRSASPAPPGSARIATFVEDLETLRIELGLGPIHLMGHSFGGLLAMHYALRHEDRLRSLILLDSMSASSALWKKEERTLAGQTSPEIMKESLKIKESDAFKERHPDAIRKLLMLSFRAQFKDPSKIERLGLFVPDDYFDRARQFAAMGADLREFDLHPQLGAVKVPTLVLYGDAEPGAEIGGRALHAAIKDSTLSLIEDAGHFPFIEQPESFMKAVRAFPPLNTRPDQQVRQPTGAQ